MTTLSIRIDDETHRRLELLAGATERSKTYLLGRALVEYLDNNEWQIGEIRASLVEADSGLLLDHGQIRGRWEEKLAASLDAESRT